MMTIYCDESGGVGRGVMTLAAVQIEPQDADALLARFRVRTIGRHSDGGNCPVCA
jgi:hypothetical protein